MSGTQHPLAPPIRNGFLNRVVTLLAGLRPLMTAYDRWLARTPTGEQPISHEFLDYSLDFVGADIIWDNPEQLAQIPESGPVIVACNHPLGGLEGMLMTRELLSVRSDVKVLTNRLLLRFEEFSDLFIGVEVFDKQASQFNMHGIRAACKHLQNGGLILLFPAGAVARVPRSRPTRRGPGRVRRSRGSGG